MHLLDDVTDPAEAVEIAITRVRESLGLTGHADRIDPERWEPLILSSQRFFTLGDEAMPSRLNSIDEDWYRG